MRRCSLCDTYFISFATQSYEAGGFPRIFHMWGLDMRIRDARKKIDGIYMESWTVEYDCGIDHRSLATIWPSNLGHHIAAGLEVSHSALAYLYDSDCGLRTSYHSAMIIESSCVHPAQCVPNKTDYTASERSLCIFSTYHTSEFHIKTCIHDNKNIN